MKKILTKISDILKIIFGYGIMLCLFAGALTFFGYIAALIIGGNTAALICEIIYKTIIPYIIKASTILVLLGLLVMYLRSDSALTPSKKKAVKHEGEM